MIRLLFLVFLIPNLATASWECDNWIPGISTVLNHVGMRSSIVVLTEPTTNIYQAHLDLVREQKKAHEVFQKYTKDYTTEGLYMTPHIVEKNGQYQVILGDCYTKTESYSLLLHYQKTYNQGLQIGVFDNYRTYEPVDINDLTNCFESHKKSFLQRLFN